MKILFILITIISLSFKPVSGNDRIDNYTLTIDNYVSVNKLTIKDLDHMSIPGGAVSGYYLEKKLVLIKTTYNGEMGYHSFDFYIMNDTLVFVREKAESFKIPEDKAAADKYYKKHTDKKGVTDFSKLPLDVQDNNWYYISENTIIDFQLTSFNKAKRANEDEIAEKNKTIIEHYQSHLTELQ